MPRQSAERATHNLPPRRRLVPPLQLLQLLLLVSSQGWDGGAAVALVLVQVWGLVMVLLRLPLLMRVLVV